MPSRNKSRITITNPSASRLPRPLGQFGFPPAPEPITTKPRARVGERIQGRSVTVTNPAGTNTTKARGGSA